MFTQGEIDFLSKIPSDKIVKIFPYDSAIDRIASEVIDSIHQRYPDLEVIYMGASGLQISGQGDIDIYCLATSADALKYLAGLTELFGQPKSSKPGSVAWNFQKDGHEVELYLTDPDSEGMKRQIAVYQKLKNNSDLLKEYEQLKQSMNGKSLKEYREKKYEFYHKILGE